MTTAPACVRFVSREVEAPRQTKQNTYFVGREARMRWIPPGPKGPYYSIHPTQQNNRGFVALVEALRPYYQVRSGGGRKQRGTLPARLGGASEHEKSRPVDKTKRLFVCPWTPREGRPPKERSRPRTINIAHPAGKVKPAGQKSPARSRPGGARRRAALTAAGQWESGGGGAHALRVDPG